ncbi:MAG: hypothetical protein K8F91_06660, partial [Candidatus Obscuribacterales bacterium]|nr:hypothetical protein [Candidatus Obscuribacterales bacterium]
MASQSISSDKQADLDLIAVYLKGFSWRVDLLERDIQHLTSSVKDALGMTARFLRYDPELFFDSFVLFQPEFLKACRSLRGGQVKFIRHKTMACGEPVTLCSLIMSVSNDDASVIEGISVPEGGFGSRRFALLTALFGAMERLPLSRADFISHTLDIFARRYGWDLGLTWL